MNNIINRSNPLNPNPNCKSAALKGEAWNGKIALDKIANSHEVMLDGTWQDGASQDGIWPDGTLTSQYLLGLKIYLLTCIVSLSTIQESNDSI